MKKVSIIIGFLAVLSLASCARKNNCPAYGSTSIDKPSYKGRN
jgi:hypothetical protein